MLAATLPARNVAAPMLPHRGLLPRQTRLWPLFATLVPTRSRFSSTISLDSPLSQQLLAERSNNVFISNSTNPYRNLAIEDHLLTFCNPSSQTLFFYRNRPCVVIGRNQNPWLECDLQRLTDDLEGNPSRKKANLAQIALVRRRSGGGTVFHDLGNLNYSVIVPNDSKFNRAKYPNLVARALKIMDPQLDIKVNERNDIVVHRDGRWLKVSGSAYKLTRGRALAHGTLLFGSPYLDTISSLLDSPGTEHIKAKGVESVRSLVGNIWTDPKDPRALGNLADRLISSIRRVWTQSCSGREPHPHLARLENQDILPEIVKGEEELRSPDWRFGQTPGFEVLIAGVDGGGVELKFNVKHGKIETVTAKYPGVEDGDPSQAVLQHHIKCKMHGNELARMDWRSWPKSDDRNDFEIPQALLVKLQVLFPELTSLRQGSFVKGPFKGTSHNQSVAEVEKQGTNTVQEITTSA